MNIIKFMRSLIVSTQYFSFPIIDYNLKVYFCHAM